jgi:DNA-directed RNA polymerase subunit RPC12/RpoP
MDDKPRRPILTLKGASKPPEAPTPAAPSAPVEAKPQLWKCKPCGKTFEVPAELGDEEAMRCPACNARLGLAKEFRVADPEQAKVRARPVARHEPAAPAKPAEASPPRRRPGGARPAPQVVSVVRRPRRPPPEA